MYQSMQRRGFLLGLRPRPETPSLPLPSPLPPYAHPNFHDLCDGCDSCVAVCPSGFLTMGGDHRPFADFAHSSCDFCGACHRACTRGALVDCDPPWSVAARITDACLSGKAVSCRVCGDYCPPQAIAFPLQPGGRTAPALDTAACTGCGACVAPCPTQAIDMKG